MNTANILIKAIVDGPTFNQFAIGVGVGAIVMLILYGLHKWESHHATTSNARKHIKKVK